MSDVQIETEEAAAEPRPVEKRAERQPKVAARAADAGAMVPESVREAVETGVTQAKQSYDRVKASAEEATEALEETFAAAMRGASDFNEQVMAAFKADTRAQFDLVRDLARIETPAQAFELQGKFLNARIEAAQARSAALAKLVNRVAGETTEPVRESVLRTIRALTPAA
ncbi:MAG: phasin family protein [Hyphomicrobiales bacterium]|nr:phasin family protein [Hyphomicrobiales bacterium]